MRAYFQHFFYRSLCYNLTLPLSILHNYRHAATCKIERYFIYFTVIIFQIFKRKVFHVRKNSLVHKVFQSGLEKTIEIGMTQDTLVLVVAAIGIDIFFKDYLVASQCTGLVRTQNVHCSEILNGIKVFHDGFLFRHSNGSFRQVGSNNHRKHLRSKAYSHRYCKYESLKPIAFGNTVNKKNKRNHHKHKAYEQEADLTDTLVEGCSGTMSCYTARNSAKICIIPCSNDYTYTGTAHHIGTHETDITQFHHTATLCALTVRCFFYRIRFSSQRCLTYKQVFSLNNSHIGRNHISGSYSHYISRNKLRNAYLACIVIVLPYYTAGIGYHLQQGFTRYICFPLLPKT